MKCNNSDTQAILRKLSVIFFIIFLAGSFVYSQELQKDKSQLNSQNEWWFPILQKHNVAPYGYNNFEKVFEMGSPNTLSNRVVTLENAFILLKPVKDEYIIIKSLKALHALDSNIIKAENGSIDSYSLKSQDITPLQSISFEYLEYQLDNGRVVVTGVESKTK